MKSILQFIKEAQGSAETKTFTFNFAGFPEDVTKELETLELDNVSVDGTSITINATQGDEAKIKDAIDKVNSFVDIANKSGKRASDEAFAQKISAVEKQLKALNDFVNAEPADDEESDEK